MALGYSLQAQQGHYYGPEGLFRTQYSLDESYNYFRAPSRLLDGGSSSQSNGTQSSNYIGGS